MAKLEYVAPVSGSGLLSLLDVTRVAETIRRGGLAVLPTETGYMVAAVATSEAAIRDVFAVKGRSLSHTMHVACSSLAMVQEFAEMTPPAARILGELTPGPVTVVVRQTDRLPRELVTVNGTVGIRVPDHPGTLQVVAAVGAPVTATSLNRAGEESTPIDPHYLESLDWPGEDVVHVVVDAASIRYGLPSTLVRLTGPEPEILRTGPIDVERIRDVVARSGPA